MSEIKRYSVEKATEEAETLQPLAVLIALKRLGFETNEAIAYAKTGDTIDTEKSDYEATDNLINELNSLIEASFADKINPQNTEVTRLPGATDIQPFINDLEIVPTLEGNLLFKKEGHGRTYGPQPRKVEDREVSYFGFVQTEYGKLYVKLEQGQRGHSNYNLNQQVILGIAAPFRFSSRKGRWNAYIIEKAPTNDSTGYPPKSAYIPWRTLMGAIALQNNELEEIREKNRVKISNAPITSGEDPNKFKRAAVVEGIQKFKDWYFRRLLELGDKNDQ